VTELRFVSPRCDVRAPEALVRARHAAPLLASATLHDSLAGARGGLSLVAGTTARTTTADHRYLRKTLDVRDWLDGLAAWDGRLGIVFGREDSGLTREEANLCDQLVTVPTADYASLNLAHAVTLVCYEHFRFRVRDRVTAERSLAPDTLAHLHKAWDDLTEMVDPREWRREVSQGIFRKIVGRSTPDDFEVHNIMGVLSGALRRFDHPDYRTAKSSRVLARRGMLAKPAAHAGDEDE
jgi:TrmH family RNA methyltransferase